MSEQNDIDTWLGYLDQMLSPLPAAERDDIIGEARAHLEERLSAGLTATSALAGFGKAEIYARGFLEDHKLNTALDSRRSVAMVRALLSVAGQSLIATIGLIAFLVFSITTLGAIGCILLKIAQPQMVGVWSAPGYFALGAVTDPPQAGSSWRLDFFDSDHNRHHRRLAGTLQPGAGAQRAEGTV